jgi:hypothetical protein
MDLKPTLHRLPMLLWQNSSLFRIKDLFVPCK